MRFDWERFLRSRGINYAHSTKRQVVTTCPFCGPNNDLDGDNMSVNLDGLGWRCWRSPKSHFGRSPVELIAKLLNCSRQQAQEIVGYSGPPPAPTRDVLAENLARLRGTSAAPQARTRKLDLPPGAHPLRYDDHRAVPFLSYLEEDRGYRPSEVRWLIGTYDLHYATFGPYKWRLIFPVKGRRGELLTWTARHIGDHPIRYKQPKTSEVRVEAPHTLLGLDHLWTAHDPQLLVVTEGPFDDTRISASGAHLGVWGTCLFSLNISDEQCALLAELAERFPRVALILDPDAHQQRLHLVRKLFPQRVELPELPPGLKDPGSMTSAEATRFCLDLLAV